MDAEDRKPKLDAGRLYRSGKVRDLMTPTSEQIHEEAEALWLADQAREGKAYDNRPEVYELKDDGYWDDARTKLMRESVKAEMFGKVRESKRIEATATVEKHGLQLTIGKNFTVDADKLMTGRTAIIGASGSGKSYTVGVVAEELCKARLPFALIDTEGEYSGLKKLYDLVWVADEEESDERWGSFDIQELANQAPTAPPLILDVSECANNGRRQVDEFFHALYRVIDRARTPYLVIIEEADKFVPQVGDALPIVGEIAKRGRKRGLGLMLCTQRPSLVDKDTLSQCGNQLIGRLEIRNDLAAVAQFFPGRDLPKQLTTLEAGEFYIMGNVSPEPQRVKVRERETPQGGASPQLIERSIMPLKLTTRYLPPTADLTLTLTDKAKASQFDGLIQTLEGKDSKPLDITAIQSIHIKAGSKVEIRYKDRSETVQP